MPRTYRYPDPFPTSPTVGDLYFNQAGVLKVWRDDDKGVGWEPYTPANQSLDDSPMGVGATSWQTPEGPPEPFHRPMMYIPQTVSKVEEDWQRKEDMRKLTLKVIADEAPDPPIGTGQQPWKTPVSREPSALQQTLLTAGRVLPSQIGMIGGGALGTAVLGPGGGTAIGAGLGAAALTALGETAMEGAEKALGYRSEINPYQVAGQSVAAGLMAPVGVGRFYPSHSDVRASARHEVRSSAEIDYAAQH